MTNIMKFPKHKRLKCRCEPGDSCAVCEWGANICNTCGGAEGMMPTHCPQERMTAWQCDQVQAGTINYVRGDWRMRKVTSDIGG